MIHIGENKNTNSYAANSIGEIVRNVSYVRAAMEQSEMQTIIYYLHSYVCFICNW